jgi:hypothetical protein
MLQFFRNNQLHTAFFVIVAALPFLWASLNSSESYLTDLPQFFNTINQNKSLAFSIFSIVLLFQAFWLNNLINYFRIGKKTSFYTAIIFVLLSLSFKTTALINPSLFSNLLAIAAVQQYFRAYDDKNTLKEIFNAAFYCSLAVVVNPECFPYLLFAIAAWLKVRTFTIKEFVILLLGIIAPFYLIGTYMYLNSNLLSWFSYLGAHFGRISSTVETNLFFWITISGIGFLGLISLLNYSGIKAKTNIREQKYIDLLFFLLFFSGLFWIANSKIDMDSLRMLVLPLSIFISLNLQAIKNQRLCELQFLILIAIAIISNYGAQIFGIFGL